MTPLLPLLKVLGRYWARHKLQALLTLAGVVIGVSVYVAIRLANQGALASFTQGVEAFAGSATHRLYSPAGGGVDERLFPRLLEAPAVVAATPYLSGRVRAGAGEVPLTLHGVDFLTISPFRAPAAVPGAAGGPAGSTPAVLERFLATPGAVLAPAATAALLGLAAGDHVEVLAAGRQVSLRVVGEFPAPSGREASLAQGLVADVATWQEVYGAFGRVDEFRLILAPGGEADVQALLPPGVALEPAGRRGERVALMAEAFQLNLEALGLFSLLVAVFLIFNAAFFAVVQRGETIAFLRCIGASRRRIFLALLVEGIALGAVGGAVGVWCGRWLGGVMLRFTAGTLFEVILQAEAAPASYPSVAAPWGLGVGLGMAVSVAGVLAPAWEGRRIAPVAAIRGSRGGSGRPFPLAGWSAGGVACLGLAAALELPSRGPLALALVGATALALGAAMLCPLALWLVSGAAALPRRIGLSARLAARQLGRSIGRAGVAAAALMVALALALAIEITVASFRQTFERWLGQAINADLYLTAGQPGTAGAGGGFDPGFMARLRGDLAVAHVGVVRSRRVTLAEREVQVLGMELDAFFRGSRPPIIGLSAERARAALLAGQALVSENLAYALELSAGDTLQLPTPGGPRRVTVAAPVRNYTLPTGAVYLESSHYQRWYGAAPLRQAGVWLRPGSDGDAFAAALANWPGGAEVTVHANAAIRRDALALFERTFAITDFMARMAAFVAFIAVVSALTALFEERRKSLGYLRAIGVSRRVLGLSMGWEAVLLASTAAAVSWAGGYLMAAVLVFVVNRRAFGWSLEFHPETGSYLGLLGLAVGAAVLGSLYPVFRATRLSVVATIREE